MMKNDFDALQKKFLELKDMFQEKLISETEFKTRLKSLQLNDGEGRKWTIGAQTGKWYYFDGEKWIEARPPSVQDRKAICIYCGFENDLENRSCVKCGGQMADKDETDLCPDCGSKIHPRLGYCVQCAKPEIAWERDDDLDEEDEAALSYQVRSLEIFSCSKFFGGLGFFFGIIFGVFAGATGYFLKAVELLPEFLRALHGSLLGGLLFGLAGGVFGFILLAVLGMIIALLVNAILAVFGSIQVKLEKLD